MNEIVSLAKENELQDYKLIYPNDKNLKVIFTDNYTVVRLITGSDSNELNFLEKLFNSNKLFITGDIYQSFTLSLELDSYSRIEIKHATSNRLLNSLTFTRYSLGELLKLVNIYRSENTPIRVSAIDYDGNEIAYSEIEKELERFN